MELDKQGKVIQFDVGDIIKLSPQLIKGRLL